ncbi:hypothetical protein H2198_000279 [Neophaeococcomyces mojaviensis]|uniref:Uncharacterized protein n=1 Tax=Neophaeococcomyces mojaviensis TaxID=3383035 RepID=A0ACC3AKW0_9EURO|nr:hypothetical protein H2198_000279 [Knufia sp. JES_112]
MFKGVHRGQAEAFQAEPYPLASTAGMTPETMTNLMKGVFRLSPGHMVQSTPGQEEHNNQTPPIMTSRSHLSCGQPGVVEQDYFSLNTARDVTRAPSPLPSPFPSSSPEGRHAHTQDIPISSTKTIKITVEDAVSSTPAPKKPDPHPQESMDKFWTVFEPEYLGKVTRLLPNPLIPSSPATSKQAGDRAHVAFKSYTDARNRCIRDVRRIIRECRTHNKKYTDTHFDIERDLKITRRRDCLDGLYNTTTSGASTRERLNPTDVKRVTEIFEKPTFFDEAAGATYDDIIQGSLGDCWLLAAFSILTCNPQLVKAICPIQDPDVGVYGFVFYRDGDWHQCIIDDKLYLKAPSYDESGDVVLGMYDVRQPNQESSYTDLFQRGSKSLYFASCRNENETWVPLLEKAFAKAHGSYAALAGGQTGEAIEDLTGGVTTEIYTTNILNKDKFWYDELRRIGKDFVFSAAAAAYREWRAPHSSVVRNERRQGIVSQHAYAILDTYEGHGQRLVKMRNPWGQSEWTGPWSDGSKEWNSEWFERLQHKFGDDGVFWISYDDMLRKYKYVDRTRIFAQGWHVAQQWTSVQVPWNTTDYQQTRFQIEVPEDTDAVVVFSQLDDRYFQGLQGKYNYTLQFRIQKQTDGNEDDEDDEDDYIARSANTYELVRSNNVEVELEKGKYTVLFKVEAKKTNRRDVEAVIRENIWRKEKLMQMGTLYDLAHQKGFQGIDQRKKNASAETGTSAEQGKSIGDLGVAKAGEKKEDEVPKKDEEREKDPNRDPWNAFSVIGLRVYSKQPSLKLKVVYPDDNEPPSPMLDRDDIAKAALEEAQQNSEQTPEGSVLGEDQITERPAEAITKPNDKPAPEVTAAPAPTPAPAPTSGGTEEQPTPPSVVVIEDKQPDKPEPVVPDIAENPVRPAENTESSQVMDDLAGDKDIKG